MLRNGDFIEVDCCSALPLGSGLLCWCRCARNCALLADVALFSWGHVAFGSERLVVVVALLGTWIYFFNHWWTQIYTDRFWMEWYFINVHRISGCWSNFHFPPDRRMAIFKFLNFNNLKTGCELPHKVFSWRAKAETGNAALCLKVKYNKGPVDRPSVYPSVSKTFGIIY